MLEHSRCDNNHGDPFDKSEPSVLSVDEVFDSLNDDQVKTASGKWKGQLLMGNFQSSVKNIWNCFCLHRVR